MFNGMYSPDGNYVAVSTNGVNRMTVSASGTTEFLFPVVATTLRVTNTGSGDSFLVEDSANPDSTPFVIDASGNVGIGVAAPAHKLQINGNIAAESTFTLNSSVTGSPSSNASIVVERGSSSDVSIRWNETTDTWQYTNDGSTYADIGSGGGGAAKSTIMFLGGM